MASPLEILQKRRAAQLAEMEGKEVDYSAEKAQEDANEAGKEIRKRRSRRPTKSETKLLFTGHARKRMAQFNMSVKDVYLIVKFGDPSAQEYQGQKRVAYQLRKRSEVPPNWALRADELQGAAVVLTRDHDRPRVITVMRYGKDTRV